MKLSKFTLLFVTEHFKQTWLAYVFLIISIAYVFYISQLVNLIGLQRVIEGISLSYIAAYMFYFFINLYPEYKKEKQGIITIQNELNNIAIYINTILGIMKSFSNNKYDNFNLPNTVVYVKEVESEWKNFFNPREELTKYIYDLHKELNNIKMKYCVLPISLIIILNDIEKLDIGQKLKFLYDSLDKKYKTKIHGFPECLIKIEELLCEFEKYDINYKTIKTYQLMNEQEIKQYIKEIDDIKNEIDCTIHNGKIYKGGTRIQ